MKSGTSTVGPPSSLHGGAGLLVDDGQFGLGVLGVVGADLGAEAVFEGGDDPAPVGVVLGVGRRHQHHVQGEPEREAADLHVAFLEHVQEAHLDPLGQVGELVDGEDAPVGPGHEAVVQRELVRQVAALGDLDGVDLADEVRDRGVGGGELLPEAQVAVHPRQRGGVALVGHQVAGVTRHREVGVVADLGPRHHREPLVEERGEQRTRRVLAWPRSPRRMMSCPASRAFSSWGSTVSSKPRTLSTRGRPWAMRAAALRRSSSCTGVDSHPEARSSPRVEGRSDGGSGGMVALMAPSLGPCATPVGSARGHGGTRGRFW